MYGKVHIHGSNGASIGAQIEGGSMFLPGQTNTIQAPKLDFWTIKDEQEMLEKWNETDAIEFDSSDGPSYYFAQQLLDFRDAMIENKQPLVNLEDGKKTVELFTAIYRSQQVERPVKFPVKL